MLTREQIDRALSEGANVLSADGERIGTIGQVYVDNDDGQPSWVTVRTGLFGMSESFVPLEGARTEGTDIVIPYGKDQVKEAPRIDSGRALEPSEEDRLYQHYQLEGARTHTGATTDTPDATAAGPGTDRTDARAAGTNEYDTPAPSTDEARPPSAERATTDTDLRDTATGAAGYDTPPPATEDPQATVAQRDTTAPDTTGTERSDTGTGATGYDATPPATADARAATDTTGYDTTPPATADARAATDTTGTERSDARTATDTTGYDTTPPAAADAQAPAAQRSTTGTDRADAEYDNPAPTTEDALARPQSGPGLGAEQPATERGRLRKYVTTENVTRTVPVQREEIRIDREPITDENRKEVLNSSGSDDEGEVILHEERVIVTKESVPVERVHIGTETVTEEVTVNEEVRKEHLGTEGSEGTEEGNG